MELKPNQNTMTRPAQRRGGGTLVPMPEGKLLAGPQVVEARRRAQDIMDYPKRVVPADGFVLQEVEQDAQDYRDVAAAEGLLAEAGAVHLIHRRAFLPR